MGNYISHLLHVADICGLIGPAFTNTLQREIVLDFPLDRSLSRKMLLPTIAHRKFGSPYQSQLGCISFDEEPCQLRTNSTQPTSYQVVRAWSDYWLRHSPLGDVNLFEHWDKAGALAVGDLEIGERDFKFLKNPIALLFQLIRSR